MDRLKDLRVFLDSIYKYKSISIIGLQKNVGKTTTLNFLLNQLGNIKVGITSIGRDGEEQDAVTFKAKPKIYIDTNTIVATSKGSFLSSDATFEILDVMDIPTSLGNIVIGACVCPGFVEIAGAATKNETKEVVKKLADLGCEITIVDGALSRKTFADPEVTEASILCTGAAFSENMEVLIEETCNEVNLLNIPKVDDKIIELYESTMKNCNIAFIYSKKVWKGSIKTSINSAKEILYNLNKDVEFVFIKGVLSDKTIVELTNSNIGLKTFTIVVEDGTKLFISKKNYETFKAKGGSLAVKNEINLIGISVNPLAPCGFRMDYDELYESLKNRVKLPIINVKDYSLDVIE